MLPEERSEGIQEKAGSGRETRDKEEIESFDTRETSRVFGTRRGDRERPKERQPRTGARHFRRSSPLVLSFLHPPPLSTPFLPIPNRFYLGEFPIRKYKLSKELFLTKKDFFTFISFTFLFSLRFFILHSFRHHNSPQKSRNLQKRNQNATRRGEKKEDLCT